MTSQKAEELKILDSLSRVIKQTIFITEKHCLRLTSNKRKQRPIVSMLIITNYET